MPGPRKLPIGPRAAALVALATLAAAVGILAVWPRGEGPRPNVLLISIDTLRADRLGSYGYAAAVTPALDGLAARGVRFADATTVTPLTLPAHASLLTGTFPMAHGVRDNGGFYVNDEAVTLAEVLAAERYRTGAFVGAFVLDGRWGLRQGFDTYFDEFDLAGAELPGMDAIQRRGSDVVDRAVGWLTEDRERPFFAFVHLYDPHTPYEAPEPFRSRFPRGMSGSYDAEIAYTDAQVARLLDALAADGRLSNTYVIVVGDHGESLGEHGEQTHGFFIYQAAVAIPFIVAGPGLTPAVVDQPVRIVDVMPTLLELLRVAPPGDVQGVSLLDAIGGDRLNLMAFAETWYPRYHYGWSELMAIRDGRYKFVMAPRRELYDLEKDPRETTNLADTHANAADALERALRDLVSRTSRGQAGQSPRPVEPDVEARLRALGYVGAGVSRDALEDRPRGDPKDKVHLYVLLRQAGQDSTEGRLDEAVTKVKKALEKDPGIVEAHSMLGNLHLKSGRLPAAVEAYRAALALDSGHLGATMSLAMAYKAMGRLEDAEAGFERALAIDPRDGKALFHLGDLHMRRREFTEAEALLKQALEVGADPPQVLLELGECYIELERWDEAERYVRQAIAARPALAQAHYDLGLIHEARGQRREAIAAYEAELAIAPQHYSASFNLAKLLAADGRDADALARFRAAVESNPEFGTGYLYLAKALLDAGDHRGAEQAARRGLTLNPERRVAPLGHYVLADIYSRQGRTAEAARQVALARRLEQGG